MVRLFSQTVHAKWLIECEEEKKISAVENICDCTFVRSIPILTCDKRWVTTEPWFSIEPRSLSDSSSYKAVIKIHSQVHFSSVS